MQDENDKKIWMEAKRIGPHLGCFLNHSDWRDDVFEAYQAVEEIGTEVLEKLGPSLYGVDFGWNDWHKRAKSKLEAWGLFDRIKQNKERQPACGTCPVCGSACEDSEHGQGQNHAAHEQRHGDD